MLLSARSPFASFQCSSCWATSEPVKPSLKAQPWPLDQDQSQDEASHARRCTEVTQGPHSPYLCRHSTGTPTIYHFTRGSKRAVNKGTNMHRYFRPHTFKTAGYFQYVTSIPMNRKLTLQEKKMKPKNLVIFQLSVNFTSVRKSDQFFFCSPLFLMPNTCPHTPLLPSSFHLYN